MLDQKQFKEEMVYLGLLFEGAGTPCQQQRGVAGGSLSALRKQRERDVQLAFILSFRSKPQPGQWLRGR